MSQTHPEAANKYVIPENSKFKVGVQDILKLNQDQMTEENKAELANRGGVTGVAELLCSDLTTGLLSSENMDERKQVFGENVYPSPPQKGFWRLYYESFDDTTLLILIAASIVSFIVGMIEHPEEGWIEGTAILIAVQIVAFVTATNDYQKEKQFRDLQGAAEDIKVQVIRDGKQMQISTYDLLVGDLCELDTGDKCPCDGIFVRGDEVKSNESSLTGEPEDLTKDEEKDPFLLSGCQITNGSCVMLVIAIGEQSRWGRIKAKLAVEQQNTPLQDKLDDMATLIGYIGTGAAIGTFIAMIIVWFANDKVQARYPTGLLSYVIYAFIIGITIVVVAIPEGLPLAVTISLAYSTKKMLKDNNLIRVLAACETMGNATNICSDKTGTLTENRMTVVAGWFEGTYYNQNELPSKSDLSEQLAELLSVGLSHNSKALLNKLGDGRTEVVGNKTEGALLMMLEPWGYDFLEIRASGERAKLYPFSSKKKKMSCINNLPNGGHRVYSKGASEYILKACDKMLAEGGKEVELTEEDRAKLLSTIKNMACQALRTIGIAHRDYGPGDLTDVENLVDCPDGEGMTLEAIVGIIDPLRPDVIDAVKTCQEAGIMVRMVTGDNIDTAKAIAKQCGILTGGIALEGPAFRKMTPDQLDEVLPKLQVLARSSPDDKHTLVTRLNGKALPKDQEAWQKEHPDADWENDRSKLLPGYKEEWDVKNPEGGEVVGVTGDGTNDAPALKAGDVGLSMGLSGTEVAKEASDIVILDDKFSSIVKAAMWGRSVYDNIRKFLQFQLTVNVVALALTFIAAVAAFEPPLNAVMMLWVNLIMDTMGALALGTEPPSDILLQRMPYKRSASLVSKPMWRNIFAQSIYQLILLLIMLVRGADQFGAIPAGKDATTYLNTMIFNAFVFCQLFNEFNARSIKDDGMAAFRGVTNNPMFLFIIFVTFVFQIVVVYGFGPFTKTTGLAFDHFVITMALGLVSIPLGFAMRFIPVEEDPASFAGYNAADLAEDSKTPNPGTGSS